MSGDRGDSGSPMSGRDRACAVAIGLLPDITAPRWRRLVTEQSPSAAWDQVLHGSTGATAGLPDGLAPAWAAVARSIEPEAVAASHEAGSVSFVVLGEPSYPPLLACDPSPPAVLFWRGDLGSLRGPRVAVVGTRKCTGYGRDVARDLSADLAAEGVRVVSGLAMGIDGAAHAGVVAARGAPPVAVVGNSLDTVYPRRNLGLWQAVEASGLILSETPIGVPITPHRFPARNRIIAALADVVVVVESHERGGSLHTVREAVRRDRPVLAVPGAVRSPASAGTNQLLFDGCGPCRGVADVLVLLGMTHERDRSREEVATPTGAPGMVLDALGWEAANIEVLVLRTGLGPASVAVALDALEFAGWVAERGGWYERRGSSGGASA